VPISKISAGQLDIQAEALEDRLFRIFPLAHHWNTVLLFDEAGVVLGATNRAGYRLWRSTGEVLLSATDPTTSIIQVLRRRTTYRTRSRPTAGILLLSPAKGLSTFETAGIPKMKRDLVSSSDWAL
jgi:hypothetical protein